ncbi:MAG TPA: hypothetical protein VF231_01980, partial [Candidatus Limnocylindrales bacterium]
MAGRSVRTLLTVATLAAFVVSLMPTATQTAWAVTDTAGEDETSAAALASEMAFGFDVDVPDTVLDKDGQGTGFTLVQESTTGQYLPANLDLDTTAPGTLAITTAKGIQYKTPTT